MFPPILSILFMRFGQLFDNIYIYEAETFNSLYEIPIVNTMLWADTESTFNSLYEILIMSVSDTSILYLNFQFSLWDSPGLKVLASKLLFSFNSLYEIQKELAQGNLVCIKLLSILFMRFMEISQEILNYIHSLSILFMRF